MPDIDALACHVTAWTRADRPTRRVAVEQVRVPSTPPTSARRPDRETRGGCRAPSCRATAPVPWRPPGRLTHRRAHAGMNENDHGWRLDHYEQLDRSPRAEGADDVRRIIASEGITLDGYFADPQGGIAWQALDENLMRIPSSFSTPWTRSCSVA